MENLEIAKTTLLENDYSIVLVKENEIVNTSRKNGLLPILDLYNNDKSILENAIELLDKTNIKYKYNKKVREIRNRDNTAICPMEELALESNNADELIEKIKEKFN